MEAFMNLLSKEEKMIKNSQIPSEFYKKVNNIGKVIIN